MSHYMIGDLQGCYSAFLRLLDKIAFQPGRDHLFLTGDLVNRGPDSLGTLKHVFELRESVTMVLGNHDLHLLAASQHPEKIANNPGLLQILEAKEAPVWLNWLRRQPLLIHRPKQHFLLVHAGIPPIWTVSQACRAAEKVEKVLQSDLYPEFFKHMYGDQPDRYEKRLPFWPEIRLYTNYFTRMRFCTAEGQLDLQAKGSADQAPPGYAPWYTLPSPRPPAVKIYFGHWAALQGQTNVRGAIALDTGCVWGGTLTAERLEDGQRFAVSSD